MPSRLSCIAVVRRLASGGLLLASLSARADGIDRADPTQDPLVPELMQAQSSLTQAFSSTQIDNLSSHLQRLHAGYDPCKAAGSLAMVSAVPSIAHDIDPAGASPVAASPAGAVTPRPAGSPSASSNCLSHDLLGSRDSGIWFGGNLTYGAPAPGLVQHNYFTSPGVTVGLDHRLADHLVVGAAVGYGWSDDLLDSSGSRTSVNSTNGTLYLNFRPLAPMAVDALIGYGDASMDNRRWVDSDSAWVRGTRHGASWFGSLALSTALERAGYRLEPYLRSDFVQSTLGSYSEAGASDLALAYGSSYNNSNALSAGAVGLHDIHIAGNVLTPLVALEYQRTLTDAPAASVSYADLGPSGTYSWSMGGAPEFVTTRQLGLRYHSSFGLQSEIGAAYPMGNNPLLTPTYNASVRAAF